MKIDPTKLSSRMAQSLNESGRIDVWFYHLIDKPLANRCGSPIEAMLGAALLLIDKFDGMPGYPLTLAGQDEIPDWDSVGETRLLIPQFNFEDYRIDWAYRNGKQLTFVECDGHEFHEKTKEQVARDKLRDRRIQAAGHPILRFAGSEIWNDPFLCAQQIQEFVDNRDAPAELRSNA